MQTKNEQDTRRTKASLLQDVYTELANIAETETAND